MTSQPLAFHLLVKHRLVQHDEPEHNMARQSGEPTDLGLYLFERSLTLFARYRNGWQSVLELAANRGPSGQRQRFESREELPKI